MSKQQATCRIGSIMEGGSVDDITSEGTVACNIHEGSPHTSTIHGWEGQPFTWFSGKKKTIHLDGSF